MAALAYFSLLILGACPVGGGSMHIIVILGLPRWWRPRALVVLLAIITDWRDAVLLPW